MSLFFFSNFQLPLGNYWSFSARYKARGFHPAAALSLQFSEWSCQQAVVEKGHFYTAVSWGHGFPVLQYNCKYWVAWLLFVSRGLEMSCHSCKVPEKLLLLKDACRKEYSCTTLMLCRLSSKETKTSVSQRLKMYKARNSRLLLEFQDQR